MTTANKTEPTIGVFTGIFASKPKIKPVSDILSGLSQLVNDLKTAVTQHEGKIQENHKKIEDLHVENDASQAEIEQAKTAHSNLSNLLGIKNV